MADTPNAQLLNEVAGALVRWLKAESVPFVITGGMAVSLAGQPRLTQDIDVLVRVDEASWGGFLESGSRFGFQPRLSDCLDFAKISRVLLMRHQSTGLDVDVILSGMHLEEVIIENGITVQIEGAEVRIPRTEDLIIMKSFARRQKDIADIEALVDAAEDIDWDYVSSWTRQLAAAVEAPEIQDIVDRMRGRKR